MLAFRLLSADVRRLCEMHPLLRLLATSAILTLVSCGLLPEKVSWSDPRLVPMLEAVEAVDRASLGFTPISRTSTVRLESGPRAGYDAMLHIDGPTSRTIAFRKAPNGYRWIHEQETYTGPKTYTTIDGTFREQIVITYGIESVSGHAPNRVHIQYWGEDPGLSSDRYNLTWDQVKPVIAEWLNAK
jgi:hypothetical protein